MSHIVFFLLLLLLFETGFPCEARAGFEIFMSSGLKSEQSAYQVLGQTTRVHHHNNDVGSWRIHLISNYLNMLKSTCQGIPALIESVDK